YPKPQEGLLWALGGRKRFVFRDHTSWGELYESGPAFTKISHLLNQQTAGDLTAAALRCRIALEGRGGITYSDVLDQWEVGTVAKAQAAAGDLTGALAWVERLSPPKRVEALAGLAESLATLRDR